MKRLSTARSWNRGPPSRTSPPRGTSSWRTSRWRSPTASRRRCYSACTRTWGTRSEASSYEHFALEEFEPACEHGCAITSDARSATQGAIQASEGQPPCRDPTLSTGSWAWTRWSCPTGTRRSWRRGSPCYAGESSTASWTRAARRPKQQAHGPRSCARGYATTAHRRSSSRTAARSSKEGSRTTPRRWASTTTRPTRTPHGKTGRPRG